MAGKPKKLSSAAASKFIRGIERSVAERIVDRGISSGFLRTIDATESVNDDRLSRTTADFFSKYSRVEFESGLPILALDELGPTFFGPSFLKIGRDIETEVVCPVGKDEILAVTALDRAGKSDLETYATLYHYLAFILVFEFKIDADGS